MTHLRQPRLTHDQLSTAFSKGCKPSTHWRIGTEHEKFGFNPVNFQAISYSQIEQLLQNLSLEGWQAIYESNQIIALQKGEASITLEPGGQIELSGAPLTTIHQTCAEVSAHHAALNRAAQSLELGFLGIGFHPTLAREAIHWMPKKRYGIMRKYMPKVGDLGLDMMLRTTTVQANLDFSSEHDMARKMRIASCLQPLVTALFAASPFKDGKPSGLLSTRAACWLDTDPKRTGVPSFVFDDRFGFDDWSAWVLDVPMYFIQREGQYIDCSGLSFRDFMDGKLASLPGELPTMEDWELHISTTFPEVRLKSYLEMRGADSGPKYRICALPALWKGLLYDETALQAAWEMIVDWSEHEVTALRNEVPKSALHTPFREGSVLKLCEAMLAIAHDGLARIADLNEAGDDETIFLKPLFETLAKRQTLAEDWLDRYHNDWNNDIHSIFHVARHA